MKRALVTGMVGLTAATLFVAQAEAARQPRLSAQAPDTTQRVYEGEGWEAMSHVESISNSTPFVINFGSQTALDVLYPYALAVEATIEASTDIDVTVSTDLYLDGTPTCAEVPYHTITLRYKYAPSGVVGRSIGINCIASGDASVWGGWTYIDTTHMDDPNYYNNFVGSADSWRKNIVTHEVSHVLGLSHPNPHDANGNEILAPCTDPAYVQPLMCIWPYNDRPLGGYLAAANAGKLTPYEVSGFQQLVANDNI